MKKKIILILILLNIIFIQTGCGLNSFIKKETTEDKSITKEKTSTKVANYVEELGKDFYENYYYNTVGNNKEERANFLSKYSEIGIKINLDNLSRYSGTNQDKLEYLIDTAECDEDNTKAIIYPKSPYNKNSYKIETELDCKKNK